VNHAGYGLNYMREAFEIMREVGSPYVKILFADGAIFPRRDHSRVELIELQDTALDFT